VGLCKKRLRVLCVISENLLQNMQKTLKNIKNAYFSHF